MKVGIFDSGVGGITVLKEALNTLEGVSYIYYADNLHVPYGTKPKDEVYAYVEDIVSFLIKEKVDAIVIACNTATSIAVKRLREKYSLPIIGMEPAVKLALDHTKKGKILVTATPLTLKEEKFKKLVDRCHEQERISTLALPELVYFAEHFEFNEEKLKDYFNEKLSSYALEEYSGLVLGCTHFVYFKKFLRHFLPESIKLYDGNEGTIHHLREVLNLKQKEAPLDNQKELPVTFYYSAECQRHDNLLKKYLNILE